MFRRRAAVVVLSAVGALLAVPAPAGAESRVLVKGESTPQWSADGHWLAFHSNRLEDRLALYAIGADTREMRRLGHFRDPLAAWSPDGSRIAFTGDADSGLCGGWRCSDVYVSGPEAEPPRRLTGLPGSSYAPAWSPDGHRIAFVHQDPASISGDLYVVGSDGEGLRRMTTFGDVVARPAWSPDGAGITFARYGESGILDASVWFVGAAGSPARLLIGHAISPTWSPDGSQIAFARWGPGGSDVYVARADGSDAHLLVRAAAEPAWSPDGSRIAFTSARYGRGVDLFVINTDGSRVVRLTGLAGACSPEPEASPREGWGGPWPTPPAPAGASAPSGSPPPTSNERPHLSLRIVSSDPLRLAAHLSARRSYRGRFVLLQRRVASGEWETIADAALDRTSVARFRIEELVAPARLRAFLPRKARTNPARYSAEVVLQPLTCEHEALVAELRSRSLPMEPAGQVTAIPEWGVPTFSYGNPGGSILVFEFADMQSAATAAGRISPNGYDIGDAGTVTHADWIGPPHWFRAGPLLVLYLGGDGGTLAVLRGLLGPEFAGGGS
jgi:Tol biopolymer transport system component